MSNPIPEIMYVTPTLFGGGAERLLTNIVMQPAARGRTSVVSLLGGGVFRRTLDDAGVDVMDLGMTGNRDLLRGVFRLATLIRARRPAAVYGWMYHGNLMAFLAVLLAGTRTPLFWGVFCTDTRSNEPAIFRIVRWLNVLLSRFVDGVIYNADEARDFHHRIGFHERRSIVIPNCIDPEVFRHDPRKREELRTELGIDESEIIVAVVARVDPMKDWETVREALRDLPGVVTLAIGTGTDQLPPQAGFIGLGWRDDVVRILSAADIFLLGSAFGEGASLALGEAMLCGLPCVVTDVGGNSALVGDGGIVVSTRSVAEVREAILQLARDRGRRETLGRAAHTRASAAPPPDDVARQLCLITVRSEASR
jgi:glycosyltransferase involved in cell wall biosynthesis